MFKLMAIALGLFYSILANAGCARDEFECRVYQGDEVKLMPCEIKICASANDSTIYWELQDGTKIYDHAEQGFNEVTINKEAAQQLPDILKDPVTCYSALGKAMVICADDVSL
ncbi:hypothetical protein [Agarivorans aestuarii]|uniref:hypothetical protein n=1 Tax=Agarivorans aestuarii TaxID=1563703 RepID=UPI001C7EB3EC|nr:hypothetical protein [Agarivorans aestuarii]